MRDRVLILLVLVVSANPAVFVFPKQAVFIVPTAVLLILSLSRGLRIARSDIAIFAVFSLLCAVHVLEFGGETITASLGFLIRLGLALLAVRVVPDFEWHYSSIMYWLALVSFVFYVPVLLGFDLASSLGALRIPLSGTDIVHIGIHNFHTPESASRNSGMFTEPGSFAGYLVVAMLFLLRKTDDVSKRRFAVLTLGLLTTLSTTGYIALVPLLMMRSIATQLALRGTVRYLTIVPVVVALGTVAVAAYGALPFVGEKLEHQLQKATDGDEGAKINRFGNFLWDLDYIESRPVAGWSPRHATRAGVDADAEELASGQGNGLSGFAVKFGLVGLAMFALAAGLRFRAYYRSRALAIFAVIVIAIVLAGEQFLNAPIFLSLMFLPKVSARERDALMVGAELAKVAP